MNELFLKIINMSISASWLVLAVLILRLVLKNAPKWINVLLWGIVAVRLICPFSIESALSLIPSAETIPMNIEMAANPAIDSGINMVNSVINPVFSASFTPNPATSANPLQIWIPVASLLWIAGIVVLLLYTAISYWRLRRKVDTAVRYQDNIFQSENVASPFVLGIIKPKIYLPFNMNEQDLEHVVAHEQAHIRRKDHWWKPLGFLLLTIHWFNPLMWLAYVLLCRDIELACDEKVIKELGNEQRADYTQALVACSVNRRMIAACPLAFGEVGVKDRVKSVMNYRKPAFWIIVVAAISCIVVAVCFLTNPPAEREFAINGRNVSDLNTNQIINKIADAENLEDGSLLCVNDDNFDLMFTSDFDWANDGAIRFFYTKNDKTYSAQLRMFHDENKYFITDTSDWIEQEQFFKLFHYLDALKYMPQEEIRKLSPDADGFSVYMRNDGVPGDYDRVLKYSQNGVEDIDGWYIHLEVQPLHEVEGGAYNGSGDELIHLFYGHSDLVMLENSSVRKWFDYTDNPSEMGDELTTELPEFPDVTFTYNTAQIIASKPFDNSELTGHVIMIGGMPIWNAYFTDLTGDGYPEICATYSWGSGIIDNRVVISDYANGASYELSDRGYYDFTLRYNETDGQLYVDKTKYNTDELVESGRLVFKDNCIQVEGFSNEEHQVFQAKILEIHDGYYLVEPVEGSWERSSADRMEVPIANAHPSPEPEVGDIIEIEYSGDILETYPAQIANVYGIKVVEESEQWDLIPMVMVDGTLYLTTGHESTIEGRCGVMDGEITSQVDGSERPTVDDQSNFGTGYCYQYGAIEGTIEIYMNGKWWIYATEEVRQEIQFPSTTDRPNQFYLTIGAEGVKSIELSMPNSSGGFENADGSLLKKGERIWLENLDGYEDLCGLTITALGENGEIIWTASIPDEEENKGFTHLKNDDWEITNIE